MLGFAKSARGYGLRLTPGNSLLPVGCNRMQRNGSDRILFAIAVAWIWFVMTGLRMPWQPIVRGEEGGSGGGAIRQVFFLGCSGWAIYRMMAMGAYNQIVGHFIPAAFIAVTLVASVLWSNDTTLTIKRSIIHVLGFHVLIAMIANSRWPLNVMMKTTVYTVGISAFISFGAMIALPANCTSNPIRPGLAGVTIHPNNYGPCLYMAILMSFGVITFSPREKTFLRACRVMMLICMMLTNSMTATVAMFAAIGFYVMLTVSSYRAGLLQVGAVAGMLLIQLIGVDNLKKAFFEASGRDENLSGRDVLWSSVYNEGLKKPIFGSGYGSFWYEGRGLEITGTWNPRQSHNAYLDIFVDLGIVGLLFWMWFTHSRMGLAWLHWAGERGTRRRNAISANLAMALTLCWVGAFGESFFLKFDKFQFFVFYWMVLIFHNRDANSLFNEFDEIDRVHPPDDDKRRPMRTNLGSLSVGR